MAETNRKIERLGVFVSSLLNLHVNWKHESCKSMSAINDEIKVAFWKAYEASMGCLSYDQQFV